MIKKRRTANLLLFILLTGIFCVFCVVSLDKMQKGLDQEGSVRLEDAVKRAATTCYSIEGYYPSTLDYLIENYGVVVNDEKYHVFYEAIGSNIQPEIQVYRR